MSARRNIGVLVSGGGSNLQSILDAERRGQLGRGHVAVVISNIAGVRALERAAQAGVPTEILDHRAYASRDAYDAALVERLRAHDVEWVVLAGFMRLVTSRLLEVFPRKVINIHPSLLPAFPGLHAHRQVLAAGAAKSGCTVHYVDTGMDTGAIIEQVEVPVLPGDDEATLAARVLVEEHKLYPRVLAKLLT